jgi:hypothetical protein
VQDVSAYQIRVQGSLDENDINVTSPIQMTVEHPDPACTLFSVCTDQSGLVGLIRHLHGRGLVLLSVYRER